MYEMFVDALKRVLKDDGFSVPSQSAKDAIRTSELLLEWMTDEDKRGIVGCFVEELYKELKKCFEGPSGTCRVMRERMWRKYHEFRSSGEFKSMWKRLFENDFGGKLCPIFYQYVTNAVMEALIKEQFPTLEDSTTIEEPAPSLDDEEKSALRYVAGYVIRAVVKKIERSSHPEKRELEKCIKEVVEKEECGDSVKWINMIDRGGLYHVNNMTYMLFISMELVLREVIGNNSGDERVSLMNTAKIEIEENEDFLFYWTMVSSSWSEDHADILMGYIVDHWITLRGFSYCSSFMEKFKQKNKMTVQKSKALRKELK